MSDETFFKAFKQNMDLMGLPCPASLFGTFSAATATVAAMANAVKLVRSTATMSELLLTIPLAGGSTAIATGVAEICAVAGALAASFYVGACIGSLIKASAEVYGSIAAAKLVGFLTSIGTALGTPVANYVGRAMQRNPMMAPMRVSVVQAR